MLHFNYESKTISHDDDLIDMASPLSYAPPDKPMVPPKPPPGKPKPKDCEGATMSIVLLGLSDSALVPAYFMQLEYMSLSDAPPDKPMVPPKPPPGKPRPKDYDQATAAMIMYSLEDGDHVSTVEVYV